MVPAKEATAPLPASSPAAKAMEQPAQQAAMPPATVATVVAAAIAAAVATVVAAAIAAAITAGVATTVAAGVAAAVARRLDDRRIATAVATAIASASVVVRRDVGHVARLVVTAQSAEGHQHHDRTLHFIPPRCETLSTSDSRPAPNPALVHLENGRASGSAACPWRLTHPLLPTKSP